MPLFTCKYCDQRYSSASALGGHLQYCERASSEKANVQGNVGSCKEATTRKSKRARKQQDHQARTLSTEQVCCLHCAAVLRVK